MLNLKIALRFLLYRPLKTFVAVLSIVAGSAIFYFILNASSGLKKLVLQLTAEVNSHIIVTGDFDFLNHNDEEIKTFRNEIFEADSRITDVSYSYVISGTNYYDTSKKKNNIYHVTLKGTDFHTGRNIQNMAGRIVSKKYNSIPSTNNEYINHSGEVVIGGLFANRIGFNINQRENAIGELILVKINNVDYNFKIVGIFESDVHEFSMKTIYINNSDLHKITGLNKANVIDIKVKDPMDSSKVLDKISPIINSKYTNSHSLDWQQGNGHAVNAIYIEDVSIFIIQLFTAISITYGLASILSFNIKEKTNQIGILKAMGTNDNNSRNIFLLYSIILTTVGIILGLLLGDFISRLFMQVFRRPTNNSPLVVIKQGIFNYYSLITILVLGLGNILASLIPIRNAKKLKIIEVIKHE